MQQKLKIVSIDHSKYQVMNWSHPINKLIEGVQRGGLTGDSNKSGQFSTDQFRRELGLIKPDGIGLEEKKRLNDTINQIITRHLPQTKGGTDQEVEIEFSGNIDRLNGLCLFYMTNQLAPSLELVAEFVLAAQKLKKTLDSGLISHDDLSRLYVHLFNAQLPKDLDRHVFEIQSQSVEMILGKKRADGVSVALHYATTDFKYFKAILTAVPGHLLDILGIESNGISTARYLASKEFDSFNAILHAFPQHVIDILGIKSDGISIASYLATKELDSFNAILHAFPQHVIDILGIESDGISIASYLASKEFDSFNAILHAFPQHVIDILGIEGNGVSIAEYLFAKKFDSFNAILHAFPEDLIDILEIRGVNRQPLAYHLAVYRPDEFNTILSQLSAVNKEKILAINCAEGYPLNHLLRLRDRTECCVIS